MDITKKLNNLNEGFNVYNNLLEDEETILIPFAMSFYGTSYLIDELLKEYITDLDHNECKEVIGIDFKLMTNLDFWMKKCIKFRNDMEAMSVKSMKEHRMICTIEDLTPKTTMDFYHATIQKIMHFVELLKEVEHKISEAPVTLFGNLYLNLRAEYDEKQAANDYKIRRKELGVITHDKLISLQAQFIAEFVNSGILSVAFDPSDEEGGKVDVEQFKKQLPRSYNSTDWLKDDFDDWFVIFNRTAKWKGDIVIPDYDCAGLFIFQHWEELKEGKVNSIFYLDKMLELVNEDLLLHPAILENINLPDELNTPEAIYLLEKARQAGCLDDRYQPTISNTESALLANEIAERLKIRNKWKVFEKFWNKNNMRSYYNDALYQQKTRDFLKKLNTIFAD